MKRALIGGALAVSLTHCDTDRLFRVEPVTEPTAEVEPAAPRVPVVIDDPVPACESHRGRLVPVEEARAVDFVIYLDQSGSMAERVSGGAQRFELAMDTLRRVAARLDPSVAIAVQTFPPQKSSQSAAATPLPSEMIGFCSTCTRPDCSFESCASGAECSSGICRGGLCACTVQRNCNSGFQCAERFCDRGPPIPDLNDTLLAGSLDGLISACRNPNECWALRNDMSSQCRSFNEVFRDPQQSRSPDCDPGSFQTPVLHFSYDTSEVDEALASIAAQGPRGDTPLGPALEGMRAYVEARQTDYPNRAVTQIVVTDGDPTDCDGYDEAAIADLLREMYRGRGGIPTFVVGVFDPSNDQLMEKLRPIARAGADRDPLVVAPSVDFDSALGEALQQIESSVASCQLALPPVEGISLARLKLELAENTGSPEPLEDVSERIRCTAAPRGWFFDDADAPSTIILCPEVCGAVQSGANITYAASCP